MKFSILDRETGEVLAAARSGAIQEALRAMTSPRWNQRRTVAHIRSEHTGYALAVWRDSAGRTCNARVA